MLGSPAARSHRRVIWKALSFGATASAAWVAFALVCRGFLDEYVFNVYSDLVREIVQVQCGRVVDGDLIYTLTPGTCRFRNPEFDTELRIDSDGFRNSSEHRGSGALSVAVLGDSFAMGWGVEQEETLASLLARDPRLNVRNLSMSSYGTVRELMAFERFAPDARVVVIQYCQNDVSENSIYVEDPEAFEAMTASRRLDFETFRRSTADAGANRRVFRSLVGAGMGGLAATWRAFSLPPRKLSPRLEPGLAVEARTFAGVLARFRESLDDRVVIVFDLSERRVRGRMDDAMRRELDHVGLSRVRVLDLENVIEMEDYFHIDEHLNARGHAKLARRILEELERLDLPIRGVASTEVESVIRSTRAARTSG